MPYTKIVKTLPAATSQAMTKQHEEDEVYPYLANDIASFNALADNLKPSAKLPRGFGLWSDKMQRAWMASNQKKA